MSERDTIAANLRRYIDEYLKGNSNRNLSHLARRCGVAESTVRRIYNDMCLPNRENTLKILCECLGENNPRTLLRIIPPDLKDYISAAFPYYALSESFEGCRSSGKIDEAIRDDYYSHLILTKISHRGNFYRSDVEKMMGQIGVKKLNVLIQAEVVLENNDGLLSIGIEDLNLPISIAKRHAPKFIRDFSKESKIEDGNALLYNFSENTSKEVYDRCLKIQANATLEMWQLVKESHGDVPILAISMVDTLDFQDEKTV